MLTLVWSPVRYFETRLQRPPNWVLSLSVPAICGLLDMAAVLVLSRKNTAALEPILHAAGSIQPGALQVAQLSAVLTIAGYPIYFALTALILVSVDVLFKDSGRQQRLVEFAGLAFLAFLPSGVFMLGVAVFWSPPPVGFASTSLDLEAVAASYVAAIHADPWLSTAGIVYYASLAWCAALLGVVLKVTSAFSNKMAALASGAIFVGISGLWR